MVQVHRTHKHATSETKDLGLLFDENATETSFDSSVLEHVPQDLSDLLATFCVRKSRSTVHGVSHERRDEHKE
jgi:hypothetical protein